MANTPKKNNEKSEERAEKKPRRAARKATRPAKKTSAKKPEAKQAEAAKASGAQPNNIPAEFDRSTIGNKTRVHALAKQLGMTSKDLVVALDAVGLVKVAQSSLSRDEVNKLLDSLSPAEDNANEKGAESSTDAAQDQTPETTEQPVESAQQDKAPERKIRTRVRKNVANEITQIQEKVDADLASAVEEARTDEPLEDITPEITPAPEAAPSAAYAPVFVAPGSDSRSVENDPDARRDHDEKETLTSETLYDDEAEVDEDLPEEPVALKGSARLESQRRRRNEMREISKKSRQIVSQAEFLARRESVQRTMVVRERERHDHPGRVTQVAVLEDELLVEHFVTSETQTTEIGNIYLGRVQNVLPSMEAAFIDIGTGRNGVLYATDIDWKAAGLGGGGRKIEKAMRSGDQVLVQVTKDSIGHKGPRLSTQISLAGRYLVYVPRGRSAGISRKLPGPERKRLKDILSRVIPGEGGAIIRTAAENVPEEAIAADVHRLHTLWEQVQKRSEGERKSKGAQPVSLYEEPDMLVKVVRDLFNDDFTSLVVDGDRSWNIVKAYVDSVAPDLADRLVHYKQSKHDGQDAFAHHRIDEQLQKALGRKVWLPSGGHLIFDRTEAMTVVDVNTGKFTGSGGNLEETVTRNNLEAAEEIVRQMRLRDIGGMIVVDFIDMVLPDNQELVLRRLKETLGRDRTRHQVSEVTSLGLVQMTRKRLGTGLLSTFSTECEHCGGRGLILHEDPVEHDHFEDQHHAKPQHNKGSKRQEPKRQEPKAEQSKKKRNEHVDLEEIAASVVRTEEPAEQQESASEKDSEEKKTSRRRGNRGRSRGRGSVEQQKAPEQEDKETSSGVSDVEAIVNAALDAAAAADPDEPSDSDYVVEADEASDVGTGEKSFQQAVADFDASPRRRRSTRGNSRSDHRPKRSGDRDVKQTKSAEQPKKKAEQPKRQPEQPKREEQKPAAESSGRRGRRRAVRKMVEEPAQNTQPQQLKKQQQTPVEKPPKDPETGPGAKRRRRRATRQSSTPK